MKSLENSSPFGSMLTITQNHQRQPGILSYNLTDTAIGANSALNQRALDPDYIAELQDTTRILIAGHFYFAPAMGDNAQEYKGNTVGEGKKKRKIKGAKEPALKSCDVYQYQRPPNAQEVQSWFGSGIVGGLGIYTGNASRLFFLDTDDPNFDKQLLTEATANFPEEFPQFEATYTERTPSGGKHRLCRLPPDADCPSTIKAERGELRGKGAFTVIAPTRWRNKQWKVEHGDLTTIHTVSEAFLQWLIDFYKRHSTEKPSAAKIEQAHQQPPNIAYSSFTDLENAVTDRLGVTKYDTDGFSNNVHCPLHDDETPSANWSRNTHTLYCHRGCASPRCEQGVVKLIDVAAALGIALRAKRQKTPLHLSLLKAILQRYAGRRGETFATVLLALKLNGIEAGQEFTRPFAVKACAGIVGREGVDNTLKTLLEAGTGFFSGCEQVTGIPTHTSKNTCSQPEKNSKSKRGRPIARYIMPDEEALARVLGVQLRGVVSVTLDDLRAHRKLVDLLLEEHVKKQPGKYAPSLLAQQYGKGVSTIRTHIRHNLRIVREPTLSKEVPITDPEQVIALTDDPRQYGGRFLLSLTTGEKLKPTAEAAAYVLKHGGKLVFCELGVNHLSINPSVTKEQAQQYRSLVRSYRQALRFNREYARLNTWHTLKAAWRADIRDAFEKGEYQWLYEFNEHLEALVQAYREASRQPVIQLIQRENEDDYQRCA